MVWRCRQRHCGWKLGTMVPQVCLLDNMWSWEYDENAHVHKPCPRRRGSAVWGWEPRVEGVQRLDVSRWVRQSVVLTCPGGSVSLSCWRVQVGPSVCCVDVSRWVRQYVVLTCLGGSVSLLCWRVQVGPSVCCVDVSWWVRQSVVLTCLGGSVSLLCWCV